MENKKIELEKLLDEWRVHLINKEQAPYAGSLFRPDGFICDNIDDFDGVLIIGKESNNSDDYKKLEKEGIGENDVIKTEPYFWFKNVVDGKANDSDRQFVLKSAILHECVKYCNKNNVSKVPDSELQSIIEQSMDYMRILKNSAFMNYKKVGGKSVSNIKELKNWSKDYGTEGFIIQEIGIISPSSIIIYGDWKFYKYVKELVCKTEQEYHFHSKKFWSYHPSYPKNNKFDYLAGQIKLQSE